MPPILVIRGSSLLPPTCLQLEVLDCGHGLPAGRILPLPLGGRGLWEQSTPERWRLEQSEVSSNPSSAHCRHERSQGSRHAKSPGSSLDDVSGEALSFSEKQRPATAS